MDAHDASAVPAVAAARHRPQPPFARGIGIAIFASRWLQAPLYFGLIVAQLVYVVQFMVDLFHMIQNLLAGFGWIQVDHPVGPDLEPEATIMLAVLGLVDVVMIANLLIMVIIGGYETFVARIGMDDHPDQPEWLSHVNANVLKVKLAMAIIGISSIHLLRAFIMAEDLYHQNPETAGSILLWQTLIHVAFILSAVALAVIDRIGSHQHRPNLTD